MSTAKKVYPSVTEANLGNAIEHAVTYLECASVGKQTFSVEGGWFVGTHTIEQVCVACNLLGEYPQNYPGLIDKNSGIGLWCNGSGLKSDKAIFEVFFGYRPSFTERNRLKTLRVIPSDASSVYRMDSVKYFEAGDTKRRPSYWLYSPRTDSESPWLPVGIDTESGALPTGKFKMKFTGNGNCHVGEELRPICGSASKGLMLIQWMKWGLDNLWHVKLSAEDSDRAMYFCTSAAGVRGFFNLRDKPEGKSRRAALQHWVKTHGRVKVVDDEGVESDVRGHVRGEKYFSWFGLKAEVMMPERTEDERAEIRENATKRGRHILSSTNDVA